MKIAEENVRALATMGKVIASKGDDSLTAVHVTTGGHYLTAYATDKYRAAELRIPLPAPGQDEFETLTIPTSLLSKLAREKDYFVADFELDQEQVCVYASFGTLKEPGAREYPSAGVKRLFPDIGAEAYPINHGTLVNIGFVGSLALLTLPGESPALAKNALWSIGAAKDAGLSPIMATRGGYRVLIQPSKA